VTSLFAIECQVRYYYFLLPIFRLTHNLALLQILLKVKKKKAKATLPAFELVGANKFIVCKAEMIVPPDQCEF